MSENLELRFGASAAGADAVINELVNHVQKLNATMGQIGSNTGQTNALLANMASHFQNAGNHARTLTDHAHAHTNALESSLEQLTGIHRKYGEIAALAAEAFAVREIYEFAEAHAHAAEMIVQESQRLGMSVTQLQEWNAVATMTGHTGDEFVQAFTRLERAFERSTNRTSEQAGALRQLGLNADAARTPNELLLQIADRFKNMADGPQKVAIAMALMGRSGAQNIPILNLGSEAIRHMMEEGQRYGAVMDESMIATNAAVAESLNTSKLAAQGLGNMLFAALAPAIVDVSGAFNQMVLDIRQSNQEGGTAATTFSFLGATFRGLAVFVVTFGAVIQAIILGLVSIVLDFVGAVVGGWELIKAKCRELGIEFTTLGQVIYYSLTQNFMAAYQAISSGMEQLQQEAIRTQNAFSAAANPWFASSARLSAQADATMVGAGRFMQRVIGPGGQPAPAAALPQRPTSMQISPLSSGGGHHGGGVSEVTQWEQQLHQMEITSGEYFRDQTARELQFWQDHLAMTTQGSRTWYQVQDKIFTLSRRAAQENYQEQISALDFEIQSRQGHYDQMAEIEARKVELVRTTYGEESRQYRDVLREQLRMQQQHDQEILRELTSAAQQRAEIERQAAQTDFDIEVAGLGMLRNMIDYGLQAGTTSRIEAARARENLDRREYAARVAAEDRDFQLTLAMLHDQMELENLSDQERAALYEQRERALADHENRMRHLALDNGVKMQTDALATATAYRDTWMSRLQPVTDALTQMVNGFLSGTTNLRTAILQMGSSILQAVNSWIMRWVLMHIAGEHAKTAATVAGNAARTASEVGANATGMAMNAASAVSEITTHGAVAAAGALRAISHIPVIGPFIAPAIAAGILALAMSFISRVASAEGGWAQVPSDGMMTELHKDEMVLPSSIASPLRDALSGPGWSLGATGLGSRSPFAGGGGGDGPGAAVPGQDRAIELHIHTVDARSVKRLFMDNRHELAEALRSAARDNV